MLVLFATAALRAVAAAPAVAQTASGDPPGNVYDVGGVALHLHCEGHGEPAVIIDGGAATWSLHYAHLLEPIRAATRACVYDRAGYGWSGPSPLDRTSDNMAAELHALLETAGEPGPFVLVGHSLGGYTMRVFADRWPDEVAALVLVESAHPDQFERLPPEVGAAIDAGGVQLRAAAEALRAGQWDPSTEMVALPVFAGRPALEEAFRASVRDPETYVTQAREFESARRSAAQAGGARIADDVPLVVITAGNSFAVFASLGIDLDATNAIWLELQTELLALSTAATQLLSETATHEIQLTDPDLVVEGIVRAVRQARARAIPAGDARHGLTDRWRDYLTAWNAAALEPLLDFFAEDAVLMPPGEPAVRGETARREWIRGLFEGYRVDLEMPTLELVVMGDISYRTGSYRLALTSHDGAVGLRDRGKFLQVWQLHPDGRWRILRGILNSDLREMERTTP